MGIVRIPTPDQLRKRLDGVHQLLTATKWERAAIVYAYSAVGGPRNTPTHTPPPPKMNIRGFAAQGYKGLTTPKAVARYRDAWLTAMSNGWAKEAVIGQAVALPDEWPFPAWDGSVWEEVTPARHRSLNRPLEQRVLSSLDAAAASLRRLADAMGDQPLDREARDQLVERLVELRDEADAALDALGAVRA